MNNDNRHNSINQEVTDLLAKAEDLIDEEIETKPGSTLLVHHRKGNSKDKAVIGTSRKGKSKILGR